MVTTELGACEWFVWDLRRSNLIDRGQLDQIVGEFLQKNPRAEPPALAEFLVDKKIITQFQSSRLLQGKTQGFVLGPFTLMDAIGSGSMGTVYKAQSKTDQNWYAVKVLPRRSMWNVRIARRKVRAFEQCKLSQRGPPSSTSARPAACITWPGRSSREPSSPRRSPTRSKLSARADAAHYSLQIAEGLASSHEQGLFHGLLKPSNLMIGQGNQANQVFILDFGIGCLLAETEGESLVDTMSTSNSVTSGLDFASPESIMDPQNLTPAGDQYSLGCMMYYMLTGQLPFPDGSVAEKMMAHQTQEPTPIHELAPDVSPELIAVVERLMKKSPDQRFANSAELVQVLKPLAREPAPASPALVSGRPMPGGKPSASSLAAKSNSPPVAGSRLSVTDRLNNSGANVISQLRHGSNSSVSTPTPKPMAMGTLPSRTNLRSPEPAAPPAPEPLPEIKIKENPEPAQVTPTELVDSALLQREERFGTLGITISAVAASILVFFLARMLRLF